jgi:hypothetical protein
LVAALLFCYHPAIADVYYYTSTIYDVLCYFFYFLAVLWYLQARERGRLRISDYVVVCLFYVAALNAKEMAVTLPIALLVWEGLVWASLARQPHDGDKRFFRWLIDQGRLLLFLVFVTAAYVVGKLLGPSPLIGMEAYRPVLTLPRFLAASQYYLDWLALQPWFGLRGGLFICWALGTAAAILIRRVELRWAWIFTLVSTLPIVFISPRSGCSMLLCSFGWALFGASLVTALADGVARLPTFATRSVARKTVAVVLVLLPMLYVAQRYVISYPSTAKLLLSASADTSSVIDQVQEHLVSVPTGSKVMFLDDLFGSDWDMLFITALHLRDSTIQIKLGRGQVSAADASRDFDYVLRFDGKKLVRLKPPQ